MTRRSYKIIKTTPMAPAGCHTHRHASRDSYYKNMINIIHHIYHSSHSFGHIEHTLQKQVRCPLIVVACFTWLLWVSSKNVSYLRKTTTVICQLLFTLHKDPFHRIRSDESGRDRHPPATLCIKCMSVGGTCLT